MNSYELSRSWFDWCFENPEKIKPVHTAMYFFIIEHCNRLGWKEKFGLPMEMTKDAIGISNYRTYSSTLNDLIDWGFLKLIQKSKNQHSSTVIAIVKNTKASTKALDKAMIKHSQKQGESIVCIDKPINKEQETINKELQPIFDLWIKYRDEIKKSIKSESTLNSLIKKMNSHTIGECDYIINLSISNQWQGLFWDKLSDFKSDTSATKKLQTNEVKFRWFSDPNTMVRTMDKDLLIKTAEQAIGGGDYPIYL